METTTAPLPATAPSRRGFRIILETRCASLASVGCDLFRDRTEHLAFTQDRLAEAKIVAANSDVVILCVGLDETLEGEEGDTGNSYASGDKETLQLASGSTGSDGSHGGIRQTSDPVSQWQEVISIFLMLLSISTQ